MEWKSKDLSQLIQIFCSSLFLFFLDLFINFLDYINYFGDHYWWIFMYSAKVLFLYVMLVESKCGDVLVKTSTYIFIHRIHLFFMTYGLICRIWENYCQVSGPFMFNSFVKSKKLALTCSVYGIERGDFSQLIHIYFFATCLFLLFKNEILDYFK